MCQEKVYLAKTQITDKLSCCVSSPNVFNILYPFQKPKSHRERGGLVVEPGTPNRGVLSLIPYSTHNLCFGSKIRKIVYPCKPQFYYIKWGGGMRGYSIHGHVILGPVVENFVSLSPQFVNYISTSNANT